MTRPKALITGASSGIGKTYAQKLAERGYDLVLVARDRARLEQLAAELAKGGATSDVVVADLTRSAAVGRIEQILEKDAGISFFLNNAGIATVAPQLETPVEMIERLIALNVTAATRLALAAGRAFVARKSGTIVNMASVVAVNPERFNGVYGGSKAFMLALSQALTRELNENGVTIQTVLPGAVRTEIWERAGTDVDSRLPPERIMDVDEMVDAALKGLELGERITIPSLPDAQDLADAEAARLKLGPNLSWAHPAERYR
ncbi:MAG TPA: SDR family NAD(P)-dependent oxidoreductase [Rhizomicrobium sp.]|nr:SDR family NAD(P)-dependent oxidoreductase [Rhizomicrobium sp.]